MANMMVGGMMVGGKGLRSIWPWHGLFAGIVLLMVAGLGSPVWAAQLDLDPAKTLGPEACGECHKDTFALWKETHHAKSFRTLPRSDEAKAIAKKLGIKRIKRESVCLTCHFTAVLKNDKERPIAAISCESCHGAGQDWIKVHSDYGGREVTIDTETAEHKAERISQSEAAGMIRPVRMVEWASNCYQCHTVPQEKLVNEGGHVAGSAFELVSWSQGEVRHNVWFTGGKSNPEAAAERKRMMYVVGRTLDLSFALRGVAKSTEKARYAVAMAKRAKDATGEIQKIADLVSVPEIDEILAIAGGAELKLNNEAALTAAADNVDAAVGKFAANHDGSALAALDQLIPASGAYKGAPAQ